MFDLCLVVCRPMPMDAPMGHLAMQGTPKAAPCLRSLAVLLIIKSRTVDAIKAATVDVFRSAALGSWGTSRRSATASVVDRNTGA